MMIIEMGHFFLHFACFLAFALAILPHIALYRQQSYIITLAPIVMILIFISLLLSFVSVTWAFIVSDFSLLLVQSNSSELSPLLYRITGVWGNHEGSLLLWVLTLALFGLLLVMFGKYLDHGLKLRTLAIQSLIIFAFLLFMILTSNPFIRLNPPPSVGADLNPLLQDPGLAFHPPMLYIGYVGVSLVFSFAVAGLINGRVDKQWACWVRPWALLAWIFLTAGIALGSWWAYYELGWGGFWFWDPVENASFIPWLVTTALLHSAIVSEKRDMFKSWTILLAILAFAMSLTGTFLVRSGVLTSVHAFANDPERGFYILLLLSASVIGAFAIYAIRAPYFMQSQKQSLFTPLSRESFILGNNIILSISGLTILLGTLYPIFLEIITNQKISVGAPYFNLTFGVLMLPIFALIGIAPLIAWKRGSFTLIKKNILLLLALWAIMIICLYLATYPKEISVLIGFVIAGWVMASALIEPLRRIIKQKTIFAVPINIWGMSCAHFGVGVLLAGVIGTSLMTQNLSLYSKVGERHELGGEIIHFKDLVLFNGENYQSLGAVFTIEDNNKNQIGKPLMSEIRTFAVNGQKTTEAAIASHFLYDYYFVLGDGLSEGQRDQRFLIRLYRKPLAIWLWLGSGLLVLGGVFALYAQRTRKENIQQYKEEYNA